MSAFLKVYLEGVLASGKNPKESKFFLIGSTT